MNVSQDGIACEGFSPLRPPEKKFGTLEAEPMSSRPAAGGQVVIEDSVLSASEVRSQVSSRYMENYKKNFELGR